MSNEKEIDWQQIGAQLRAPFDPADVDFRPIGKTSEGGRSQVACYIDARTVANRLDEVVGPGAWSFTYEALVIDRGDIQIAKGALTIHSVTKEDVGDASNMDASKGCVSDALKRAAVLWGIGRYLYDVGSEWVALDQYKRIAAADVQRLRAKLPRPDGARPPVLHKPADKPAPAADIAPVPPEMAQAAREAAAATTVTTVTKEPYRTATPTQWDTIRRGCTALDQEPPEPPISFEEASALIAELSEKYKRQAAERQKAGAR